MEPIFYISIIDYFLIYACVLTLVIPWYLVAGALPFFGTSTIWIPSRRFASPLIPVIKNYYPKKGERINLSYPILKLFITHTDIVIIFQHDIKSRLDHLSIHISMVCWVLITDITFSIADTETAMLPAYLPVIWNLIITFFPTKNSVFSIGISAFVLERTRYGVILL